jgi:outer membrane receptor protein involved in Fe transport
LEAAGLSGTPATYKSDSVWAYEAGAKLRLFDRAQVNSSLFYINWKDIQYSVGLPGCVFNYTANAAQAVSQGADVQANIRLIRGLAIDLSASYTDAHYTRDMRAPVSSGIGALLVGKGNTLPTPPWQVQMGLRYDLTVANQSAYIRGDYQFASAYHSGLGPGTSSYAPDTYNAPATNHISARAGVVIQKWDLSLFVNNLANSHDLMTYSGPTAGRYSCTNTACTTYNNYSPLFRGYTFRPREIGVVAVFRY